MHQDPCRKMHAACSSASKRMSQDECYLDKNKKSACLHVYVDSVESQMIMAVLVKNTIQKVRQWPK